MKMRRIHVAFTTLHYYYGFLLLGLSAFSVMIHRADAKASDFAVTLSTIALIHLITTLAVLRRKTWARWATMLVMLALVGLATTSTARILEIGRLLTAPFGAHQGGFPALLFGLLTTAVTATVVVSFAAFLLIFPIAALVYYNLPHVKHQFDK